MSRGSYQRRVWITALQHNEGYSWHSKYMLQFAGCGPGAVLRKFVEERNQLKLSQEKSKLRPGYSRKAAKPTVEEKDYGEEALAKNEIQIDFVKTVPAKIRSYTVILFRCLFLTEAFNSHLLL